MAQIICVSAYENLAMGLVFTPGEYEVDDYVADYLLRDSPGSFTRSRETVQKAPSAPPVDKMIDRSPKIKQWPSHVSRSDSKALEEAGYGPGDLEGMTMRDLMDIHGIGPARARRILNG